jgi:hypothetical protein
MREGRVGVHAGIVPVKEMEEEMQDIDQSRRGASRAMDAGLDERIRKIAREEAERATRVIEIDLLKQHFLTRDEFLDAMERMDKRFTEVQARSDERFSAMQAQLDKRFEAVDKRFEALIAEMHEGFDAANRALTLTRDTLKAAIDNLGGRSGKDLENAVLELMRFQLLQQHVDYRDIQREPVVDVAGGVFWRGYSTDIDVVARDGDVHLYEVKYKADQRDAYHFIKVAELYDRLHPQRPSTKLVLVSLEVTAATVQAIASTPRPVTIVAGAIVP